VLRVWLKFAFGLLLLMGGGFMLLALNAATARLTVRPRWA
jgi:dipeptide/tripeptide permease